MGLFMNMPIASGGPKVKSPGTIGFMSWLCLLFSPEIVIIHDLPSVHAPHSETRTDSDFGIHITFPYETENHMNENNQRRKESTYSLRGL